MEYTGPEYYVAQLLEKQDIGFFPIGQASKVRSSSDAQAASNMQRQQAQLGQTQQDLQKQVDDLQTQLGTLHKEAEGCYIQWIQWIQTRAVGYIQTFGYWDTGAKLDTELDTGTLLGGTVPSEHVVAIPAPCLDGSPGASCLRVVATSAPPVRTHTHAQSRCACMLVTCCWLGDCMLK